MDVATSDDGYRHRVAADGEHIVTRHEFRDSNVGSPIRFVKIRWPLQVAAESAVVLLPGEFVVPSCTAGKDPARYSCAWELIVRYVNQNSGDEDPRMRLVFSEVGMLPTTYIGSGVPQVLLNEQAENCGRIPAGARRKVP